MSNRNLRIGLCGWGLVRQALTIGLCIQLVIPANQALARDDGDSTLLMERGETGLSGTGNGSSDPLTVGADGSANYSVPIRVPAGTGGMQPNLALTYSSHSSGDTWVGHGWSLGLGSIQRSTKEGVPSYGAGDVFELDGEELIPDPGVPNRYATKRESFLRIDRVGDHWEVRAKDGIVSRYGLDSNSRLDSDPQNTFAWMLVEREDPNGNGFRVVYDKDTDAGYAHPKEIRYTLRRTAAGLVSLDPADPDSVDRIVTFELEPRPDVSEKYITRFQRYLGHRLHAIEISAAGDQIRRYVFDYGQPSSDSGRSLLRAVKEYGVDWQETAASFSTRFDYHSNADSGLEGWTRVSGQWVPPDQSWFTLGDDRDGERRLVDINSDGFVDLYRREGAYLNTGDSFSSTLRGEWALPTGLGLVDSDKHSTGHVITDFNADGRPDVVRLQVIGRFQSAQSTYQQYASQHHNTGAGFQQVHSQVSPPVRTPSPSVSWNGYSFAIKTHSGSGHNPTGAGSGTAHLADLNGDGRPDIISHSVWRNLTGVFQAERSYALARRTGWFDNRMLDRFAVCGGTDDNCIHDSMSVEHSIRYVPYIVPIPVGIGRIRHLGKRFVDINGDGLDDMIVSHERNGAPGWYRTFLNNGYDFVRASDGWNAQYPFDKTTNDGSEEKGTRMVDINGDGRLDLVVAADTVPPTPNGIWLNRGHPNSAGGMWKLLDRDSHPWYDPMKGADRVAFAHSAIDASGQLVAGRDSGVRMVDLNGDGMPDIIRRHHGKGHRVYLNKGRVPDLLVRITNRQGGKTSFTYTPSTKFANTHLPQVLQVVSEVEVDSGEGVTQFRSFDYAGGLLDPTEREFRGFARVTATHGDGTAISTTYHQSTGLGGLPITREVRDGNGNLWRTTEFEYVDDDTAPFTRLEKARTVHEYDGESTESPRTTRTELEYGDFGNLVRTTLKGDLDHPDRIGETIYTQPNLTAYIVDRVAQQRAVDATGTVLAETWLYYDDLPGLRQEPTQGRLTRLVRWLDQGGQDPVTLYRYDAYGNRISETDPRGFLSETDFDPVFHTFPVESRNGLDPPHVSRAEYSDASCSVAIPVAMGLAHVEIDANGNIARTCYDGFGRPTLEVATGNLARTTIVYDDTVGAVTVKTCERVNGEDTTCDSASGGATRDTLDHLDGLGRIVRSETDGPHGRTIEVLTEYDSRGREFRKSLPFFAGDEPAFSETHYDSLDRVSKLIEPGGRTTTTKYSRGTATGIDANGNRREDDVNPFGELEETREFPDGPEGPSVATRFRYDFAGNLIRVERVLPGPGESPVPPTVITHDSLGRRISIDDPDTGLTTFTYNGNDYVETETNALGTTKHFRYDAIDRLTRSWMAPNIPLEIVRTYDEGGADANANGRMTSVSDDSGTHRFAHDEMGRVSEEVHVIDGKRFSFRQSFDQLGQIRASVFPASGPEEAIVVNDYDDDGYLVRVQDFQESITYVNDVHLDSQGRVVALRTGDGVITKERYDPATNFLRDIEVRRGSDLLEQLDYAFDDAGRVREIVDVRQADRSRSFTYDALNRLASATGPFGPSLSPANLEYGYDRYGNLTEKDGIARRYGENGFGPHALTSIGDSSLVYDETGNLVEFGSRRYVWNARGQLSAVLDGERSASYVYDYNGRRIKAVGSSGETRYFVGTSLEWDGEKATIHVFAADRRVASRRFDYTPPTEVAQAAPVETIRAPLPALGTIALGPPLLLVAFLGLTVVRRRETGLRTHSATAVLSLVSFWLALTMPTWARANRDTDRDGLPDADEYAYYHSDPLVFDSDGDGHSDGQEVAVGSCPGDAASIPPPQLGTWAAAGNSSLTLDHLSDAGVTSGATLVGRMGFGFARRNLAGIGFSGLSSEDLDGDGICNAVDDDVDGDGVINALDPDDDNDGLTDQLEFIFGTQPYNPDTDGDGLRDGAETQLGTNPLLADSDGDGVSDLHDAVPLDGNETSTVLLLAKGDVNDDGRLDAGDAVLAFRMAADSSQQSEPWISRGDVAPASTHGDGVLDTSDALMIARALTVDLDGDGLIGDIELAHGASPFLADTDGDGLNDAEEIFPPEGRFPTSPTERDTDHDGLLDTEEIALGSDGRISDPLDPDSDDDGILDGEDTQPNQKIVFYHGDHLASTVLETNIQGTVIGRYTYKPYGELLVETGDAPDFGFTGQRYEADFRIYDYGARFYDPAIGRFLGPDSFVPEPGDPQSLNRYSYVRNNPLSRIDPDGNIDRGITTRVKSYLSDSLGDKFGGFVYGAGVGLAFGAGAAVCIAFVYCALAAGGAAAFGAGAFLGSEINSGFAGSKEAISAVSGSTRRIASGEGTFDDYAGFASLAGGGSGAVSRQALRKALSSKAVEGLRSSLYSLGSKRAGATRGETLLPDSYWINRKAPTQVTPGTRTVNYEKPSSRGGTYHRTDHYDEYGRQIGRTDRTHHGYKDPDSPQFHPNPHHHRRDPVTGEELRNPTTGDRTWPGLFGQGGR